MNTPLGTRQDPLPSPALRALDRITRTSDGQLTAGLAAVQRTPLPIKAQLQALRRKDLTEEGYQVVQQYIG